MLKRKPLLVIAVILLFIGLSYSPVTAKVSLKEKIEFKSIIIFGSLILSIILIFAVYRKKESDEHS